jgi:predicted metalloprotease
LLKIYYNKHKSYTIRLHEVIGFYKVDERKNNTIERVYVQANRLFCLGNQSDDDGSLSGLDKGGESIIRILYAVPVSIDLRDAVAKLVRCNYMESDKVIETYAKIVVAMCVMEAIGIKVICCMSCGGW